jgi:hypothetical protein
MPGPDNGQRGMTAEEPDAFRDMTVAPVRRTAGIKVRRIAVPIPEKDTQDLMFSSFWFDESIWRSFLGGVQ